jgi:NDP-4-keto-2,6-dideoxyhexose 3-C-methyltransferase
MSCKICNSNNFKSVINLGNLPLSNFIPKDHKSEDYPKSELNMVECQDCGLVQLENVPDLDIMYRQYWYKSSLNKGMVKSLQDVVNSIEKRILLERWDIVVDIGCNDGTMLSLYTDKGLVKIGYDPALNLKSEAENHCHIFINDYFSKEKYPTEDLAVLGILNGNYRKAKVVSAIACFYDLTDVHKFIEDVKAVLDKDGIFVIQYTDLLQTLRITGFDNFVHEHVELYSFKVLGDLMKAHDLDIFDVETNNVNGGSVRAFICFKNNRKIEDSVSNLLLEEYEFFGQYENERVNKSVYDAFKEKVEFIKEQTVSFIKQENAKGKKILVLGASTKGNTLLNYFGIDNTMIPYAAEVNDDKYGLKTIGSEIEIISEKQALEINPDYFLVLPWHFVGGFREKFKNYLNNGGKFIVPCPEFKIITNSWMQ